MQLASQVKSQIDAVNAHYASPPANEDIDGAPAPAASVAPATPPAPPVPKVTMVTIPKLEYDRDMQQFRSLQGIHRSIEAERTTLRAQVDTLTSSVTALQSQVEQYRAIVNDRPRQITDAEVKEYTPELLDVVRRQAKEEFDPILTQLQTQVNALTAKNTQLEQALRGVGTSVERVSMSELVSNIERMMPEFQAVNNDPRFADWLKELNPLTGRQYNIDFLGARDARDAARVVEFCRLYQSLLSPAPADEPQARAPESTVVTPPLSELTTPNSGDNAPAPLALTPGRVWNEGEIKRFYADKSTGKYVGRETLATSLEAEIFKASRENRIRA